MINLKTIRMIVFPRSTINSVSQFEVGYSSSLSNSIKKKNSERLSFVTENKISLGLTKKEVIAIKGNKYTEITNGKVKIIRYVLDNFDNSTFLKRYNMPVYIVEYWIKKGLLVKYRFGFEHP